MRFSVMPSLRYSALGSAPTFTNGITASESIGLPRRAITQESLRPSSALCHFSLSSCPKEHLQKTICPAFNVFALMRRALPSAEAFEQTPGFFIVDEHETASVVFVRIDVRV